MYIFHVILLHSRNPDTVKQYFKGWAFNIWNLTSLNAYERSNLLLQVEEDM